MQILPDLYFQIEHEVKRLINEHHHLVQSGLTSQQAIERISVNGYCAEVGADQPESYHTVLEAIYKSIEPQGVAHV